MIIVRYSEIALKGKKRMEFQNTLIKNIKRVLLKEFDLKPKIRSEWGRIFIDLDSNKIAERVSKIFGVSSTSLANVTSSEIEDIISTALYVFRNIENPKSFAVRVRRVGDHPYTSLDVARIVGQHIKDKFHTPVNLDNPEVEIGIEIRDEFAYVYTNYETFKGVGGLPVGTQGRVLSLISDKLSLLSTWYALRRGCDVDLLVAANYKDVKTIKTNVKIWACYRDVNLIESKNEDLKDLLLEAFSLDYKGIFCSITTDNLPNLINVLKNRSMPVFTPLAPFKQEEINLKLKEILIMKNETS